MATYGINAIGVVIGNPDEIVFVLTKGDVERVYNMMNHHDLGTPLPDSVWSAFKENKHCLDDRLDHANAVEDILAEYCRVPVTVAPAPPVNRPAFPVLLSLVEPDKRCHARLAGPAGYLGKENGLPSGGFKSMILLESQCSKDFISHNLCANCSEKKEKGWVKGKGNWHGLIGGSVPKESHCIGGEWAKKVYDTMWGVNSPPRTPPIISAPPPAPIISAPPPAPIISVPPPAPIISAPPAAPPAEDTIYDAWHNMQRKRYDTKKFQPPGYGNHVVWSAHRVRAFMVALNLKPTVYDTNLRTLANLAGVHPYDFRWKTNPIVFGGKRGLSDDQMRRMMGNSAFNQMQYRFRVNW